MAHSFRWFCLFLYLILEILQCQCLRSDCKKNYTVIKGDTLDKIACAHRVRESKLVELNSNITDRNHIEIGWVFCLSLTDPNLAPKNCTSVLLLKHSLFTFR